MAWTKENLADALWIQDYLASLAPASDQSFPEPEQWNGQDNRPHESAPDPTPAQRRSKADRVLMDVAEEFAREFGWDAAVATVEQARLRDY